MEIYHKIKNLNNNRYVTIYVTYPDEYEFSVDFDTFKKNTKIVADNVKKYISDNFKKTKDMTLVLVLNGVLIGTLLLSGIVTTGSSETFTNIPTSIESVKIAESNNAISNTAAVPEPKQVTTEENIVAATTQNENLVQSNITTQNKEVVPSTNIPAKSTTPTKQSAPPTPTTEIAQPKTSTPVTTTAPTQTAVVQDKMINLKLSSGQTISIGLEEYVTGVVSAEMPASFSSEALKAQAVAARTYALKKIVSGSTLTATKADQVFKTKDELKKMWGSSYDAYYAKVSTAVYSTKGEAIKYSGKYIDALYFSTSNGKTEDPVFVWGGSSPYLKSVNSSFDVGVTGYASTKTLTYSEISSKLGISLNSASSMKVLSKTTGDRVKTAVFGSKEFTGVEIRNLLGLKSADFDISASSSGVTFTCRGYGHGVGMSQNGANVMAKQGYSYKDILTHYYTSISIVKI